MRTFNLVQDCSVDFLHYRCGGSPMKIHHANTDRNLLAKGSFSGNHDERLIT
jgi:hypothetical protein